MTFDEYQSELKRIRELDPAARKAEEPYEACLRSMAGNSFLHYNAYTWDQPDPYVVGRHTREIAAACDKAINNFKMGKSTYLVVTVPFRHGKSELISRAFPGYVLGKLRELEPELILATHGQDLSNEMSRDAQDKVVSDEYQHIFPGVKIDPRKSGVEDWRIKGSRAKLKATGLGGSFIGRGAHVLIIDDYLKNRKQADEPLHRDTSWSGFIDLTTRLAPVHIVIILATRWHVDDVIGRIQAKNDKEHEDYKAEFPKYEIMHYRAREDDGTYLFTERYPVDWYNVHFGTLPPYRIASELQGEPVREGGNMFQVDNIIFDAEMPDDLQYVRAWDPASSEEERMSEDPDYTFGICGAVRATVLRDLRGQTIPGDDGKPCTMYEIFIEDGRFCKEEAPARDAMIRQVALEDGPEVWQGTESVAGYKDKFTTLKAALKGIRVVRKITLKGDKVQRASAIEPIFDSSHVYVSGNMSQPWVALLVKQLTEFPGGKHDDGVDALVNMFNLALIRMAESKIGINYSKGAV